MKKHEKIAIIIPVYKVEKYLSAAIDSVLNQTYEDWGGICINDGSPDKCGEILDAYSQKDSRIKREHEYELFYIFSKNRGC